MSEQKLTEAIRPNIATQLREALDTAITDSRCQVSYIQGRGGLGKTYLLRNMGQIGGIAKSGARLCAVIDMLNPETRKPLNLEIQLKEGLRRSEMPVDAALLQTCFAKYDELLRQYLDQDQFSPSPQDRQQAEQERRDAFVAAWNELSAKHPLIMRFDTLELLLGIGDLPDDVCIRRPEALVGVKSVIDWVTDVLPRLRCTLVVFSGRAPLNPVVEGGTPDAQSLDRADAEHNRIQRNELAMALHEAGVLEDDDFIIIQPLVDDADIALYLRHYNCVSPAHSLAFIRQITDGVPLLLTLYTESQRSFPVVLTVDLKHIDSRAQFERRLVDTVLNPLRYVLTPTRAATHELSPEEAARFREQFVLTCCLHILSYARRGLSAADLQQVLSVIDERIEFDARLAATLGASPLIRTFELWYRAEGGETLFYLHDEIWLMIDERRLPEELGFRDSILDELVRLSGQRVLKAFKANTPLRLLRGMADHVYYSVTQDITRGYRHYLVYLDHLLSQRNHEDALVLADTFWRMLNLRVVRYGEPTKIYRDMLSEAEHLSLATVRQYDRIHYSKLLRAQGYYKEAADEAERLYYELVTKQVLPVVLGIDAQVAGKPAISDLMMQGQLDEPQHISENPESWPVQLYLFTDLLLTWAHALTLAGETLGVVRAPRFHELVSLTLGDANRLDELLSSSRGRYAERLERDDDLLRLRRSYLLGLNHQLWGQYFWKRLEYEHAITQARVATAAFQSYQHAPILIMSELEPVVPMRYLNDHVVDDIALVLNNMAFLQAEVGNMEGALRRSTLIVEQYAHRVRPYYRALMLNTLIGILMRMGRFEAARTELIKAEAEARASDSGRAIGLVTLTRARIERWAMNRENRPREDVREYYLRAEQLLRAERDLRRETIHELVRFQRDLALSYRKQGEPQKCEDWLVRSLDNVENALKLLPTDESERAVERAGLLVTEISFLNNLGRHKEAWELLDRVEKDHMIHAMPLYGQVVAGKVALQRGFLFLTYKDLYNERAALERFAEALTRAYTFGVVYLDQLSLTRLIQAWVVEYIRPDILHKFVDDLRSDTFYLNVYNLTYQNQLLTSRRWDEAWERMIVGFNKFVQ